MQTLKEFVNSRDFFVVAHRGSSGTAPENTMAAFREAVDAGAKMIETDIQITADNKVVAFHDKNLWRMAQRKELIKDIKLDELKKVDIGSWFGPVYSAERVPLLSEVMEYLEDKAYLNIEIKRIEPELIDETLRKMLDIIEETNFSEKVLISSFHYDILKYLRKLKPELPLAPIKIPRDKRLPSELRKEFGAEAYVCEIDELNEIMVKDVQNSGIFVGAYSVDTREQLDKILKYNIKVLVTNYPARIIGEMKKLGLEV